MNKTEYNKIMKLLNEGKIEELKLYLDERMSIKYINNARRTLMSIINNNCIKEYPSYFARVELHKGITKSYRGVFDKLDNGFVIADDCNVYQLYDENLLSADIEDIMLRTCAVDDNGKRKENLVLIKKILTTLDKRYSIPIIGTSKEENKVKAWSSVDDSLVFVPASNYNNAHTLLGSQIEEYIDEEGRGIYFKSPNGKVLIMSLK